MDEKLYTVEEAAKILQVHPETLRKWLKEGRIKGEKFGRMWRIRESNLKGKEN